MKKWIVTVSRHHNTEIPDYRYNLKAPTYKDALTEVFKEGIADFFATEKEIIDFPDLSPILEAEETNERVFYIVDPNDPDGEPSAFLLWNETVSNAQGYSKNIGMGLGEKIWDTNKAENLWFNIEERTDSNAYKALQGYYHYFDKLSVTNTLRVLEELDRLNDA